MRTLIGVASWLLLSTVQAADTDATEASILAAQKEYFYCMYSVVPVYKSMPISATEASVAAQGRCMKAFSKFDIMTHDAMAATMATGASKLIALQRADVLVAETRRRMQEAFVADILAERNTPPAK